MNYAFINDNKIIKIEEHDLYESITDAHLFQYVLEIDGMSPYPRVGWVYEKGILWNKLPPVTARQIRRALLDFGLTEVDILAALGTLPEPTKSQALIEWEYSNEFFRNHFLVPMVGQMLGWNSDQLDELWLLAAKK